MRNLKILAISGLITCALGCNTNKSEEIFNENSIAFADSVIVSKDYSTSASKAISDSTRKFIRTADLKFKVKDVVDATYKIENAVKQHGGFVSFTNLGTEIIEDENIELGSDSTLELKKYNINNSFTIRVPNTKLDTTLKDISKTIEFLDYRVIKADDVALQLIGNDLAQKRLTKNQNRLTKAIDDRGKKLNETSAAEELLLNKQEKADKALVNNLSLKYKINYSTVNIYIYQKPMISREITANSNYIKDYEPKFCYQFLDSLSVGFDMIKNLILFLIKIWPLILLGFLVYVLYKKYNPTALKS